MIRKAFYWGWRYLIRSVRKRLREGLGRVYRQPDSAVTRTLLGPMQAAYTFTGLLSELSEGRAYRLSGLSAGGGQPLQVAFCGLWNNETRYMIQYFEHQLFAAGKAETCEELAPFSLHKLREQAETLAHQADIVISSAYRPVLWQPSHGDWLAFPVDIRMVFDYHPGEAWAEVEQRLKGQKGNLKRIRREAFTYQVSQRETDFTAFYHDYYLPLVQARHQPYAQVEKEQDLRQVFRKRGAILTVQDANGETVAAEMNYENNGVLFALLGGLRGGDPQLARKGALAAMYYFSIKYGHELGCRRHDSGVCLPFLTDGIYQHKRLWGYQASTNYWRPLQFMFWSPDGSPAAQEWFQNNQVLPEFVTWGGEDLSSLYS